MSAEPGAGLVSKVLPAAWQGDAALLRAALDGERKAADVLTRRLLGPAHALAWRLTGNRAEAEDVVQEAFCRLWQHGRRLEPRARLSTWFHTVVHNLCMDRLRRHDEALDEDMLQALPGADPTPEEHWEREVESARLRAALERLPARQRGALMLWAWREYDVAAIARELGIAENAAHQLLFRARARLKVLLSGEDDHG